jgi:hypothetical protein
MRNFSHVHSKSLQFIQLLTQLSYTSRATYLHSKGQVNFPHSEGGQTPRGQAIFTITKGQYRHTLILITFLSLSDLAPLVWIFLLRISHPQADSAWKWFLAVAIRGLESLTADTIYRGQEKPKLAPYTSLDLLPA